MLSAKSLLLDYHQTEHQQRAEQQRLRLDQQRDKRKQADLDSGRLVRVRLDAPREAPITLLVVPRVAAYVCRLLGSPVQRKGQRVTLSTGGRQDSALYAAEQVYQALRALICHARAVTKAERRRARFLHHYQAYGQLGF